MGEDVERLKQRIPLLEYLQRHNWTARRAGPGQEFVGLCPLHRDARPSFYVNAGKNLFYCHRCGRGGDLIRLVELLFDLSFRQSVAHLNRELALSVSPAELLEQAAAFFQLQLHRHAEAIEYLASRGLRDPAIIEELRIGYAPGGALRRHLLDCGYSLDVLLHMGLINSQGRDFFCRRMIFPCFSQGQMVNLYGRAIGAAFPHRLLARSRRRYGAGRYCPARLATSDGARSYSHHHALRATRSPRRLA